MKKLSRGVLVFMLLAPLWAWAHQADCEDRLETLDLRLSARAKLWRYWGEHRDDRPLFHVRKYTPAEAERFRVYISGGRLVRADGYPVRTERFDNLIIAKGGAIYIFPPDYDGSNVRHSSLPVKVVFAGHVVVIDGEIRLLTNGSGHFSFSAERLYKVADAFRAAGLEIDPLDVEPHSPTFKDLLDRWWVRAR